MIGREHGVELTLERPHEHRVRGERPGGVEHPGGGLEYARVLVAEQAGLAGMGIEGAHREPRRRDPPPVAQRALRDPPAAHHAIGGDLRGYVLEGDVRRDEHHAQLAGGEHHRDVHVAGEMG